MNWDVFTLAACLLMATGLTGHWLRGSWVGALVLIIVAAVA